MTGIFEQAIHECRLLRLLHVTRHGEVTRRVAPLDVGPSRIAGDTVVRFHFYDYDATRGPKAASILPSDVLAFEPTGETFDPGDIVTWSTAEFPWRLPRDWGVLS